MTYNRVKAWSKRVDMPNGEHQNYKEKDDFIFEGALQPESKPNLITSHAVNDPGKHLVCLDIDMPAQLVASKSPGHYHLYIEKKMDWETYKELLTALAKAGIIEEGYAGASIARGCTALRIPPYEEQFNQLKEIYGDKADSFDELHPF